MELQKVITLSHVLGALARHQPFDGTYDLLVKHGLVRDTLGLLTSKANPDALAPPPSSRRAATQANASNEAAMAESACAFARYSPVARTVTEACSDLMVAWLLHLPPFRAFLQRAVRIIAALMTELFYYSHPAHAIVVLLLVKPASVRIERTFDRPSDGSPTNSHPCCDIRIPR